MSLTKSLLSKPLVVLSPHHDDAAWSLSGLLSRHSNPSSIVVISVFTRSIFVYGEIIDIENASQIRRQENIDALENTGINTIVDLEFPEALVRGETLKSQFRNLALKETILEDAIYEEVSNKIIDFGYATLLAPVAFGNHVDHILTRNIATRLDNYKVYYYEDMPYASRERNNTVAKQFIADAGIHRKKIRATKKDIRAHTECYYMYDSQSLDRHSAEIAGYLSKEGYGIWG